MTQISHHIASNDESRSSSLPPWFGCTRKTKIVARVSCILLFAAIVALLKHIVPSADGLNGCSPVVIALMTSLAFYQAWERGAIRINSRPTIDS